MTPTETRTAIELLCPQVEADAALAGWGEVWANSCDPDEPWCQAPTNLELNAYAVPRVTSNDVLDARGRFGANAGLGEAD
eukprot:7167418-Pyramimonas_sp.AAC.2